MTHGDRRMRMKQWVTALTRVLTAAALTVSALSGLVLPEASISAADSYRFDFGNGGTESGYIGVSAGTAYNASQGYGFCTPSGMKDVSASGSGVCKDAVQFVQFGTDTQNTFAVDLPVGLYQVTVTLGNTNRTSVAAEGVYQLMNLTGNFATDTFQIPVTDGQLNLNCTAGKENYAYTLSALEIQKLSDNPAMKPTIWLCGDSTVCNYYPLATSAQAGWGQLLPQFVDRDRFEVRNLATGGQYAKGFLDSGQFAAILKYIKPGDYYFISIGINDTNYSNATEYAESLTTMVTQAKDKGATVILVAQQGRQGDISNSALHADSGRWFNGTVKQVASAQGVQCIDLFSLFYTYCASVGQSVTDTLYIDADTLHPNRAGATVLARLVSEQVNFDGAPVTTSTTTTTTAPPPPERRKQGDLNGDGKLNLFDDTMFRRGLLFGFTDPLAEYAADIDGDGAVRIADLVLLRRFLTCDLTRFPVVAAYNRYDAIDAAFTSGISETVNAGFSGTAYVNLDNAVGSDITWSVTVPESGNYLVNFRMANGSVNNRPMRLEVDGDTASYWMQDFLSTGAWTTWVDRGIVLPLNAGINTLHAISETAEGGPNLDYITLQETDEPVAEVYQPNSGDDPVTGKATVYIAGDSTVQTYRASYAPQQGWGAYLEGYFDSSQVAVSNHAIAGRSSKSFYDNGRLDTILHTIQPGDYLLVQFGINDAASSNAERYAPVCGSVAQATAGSFEAYLKLYVEGAKQKGATPVLVTTTIGLKAYSNGHFVNSYDNYCNAMKQVAAYYSIPCIDLNSLMVQHYNQIGYDKAYTYHMISAVEGSTDMTHFTEMGAKAVAGLVAGTLRDLRLPISQSYSGN